MNYANLKKTKEKNGVAEYSAEIPLDVIKTHEAKELAHIGRNAELPGFRKGKVPETMLRERVDPAELLEDALQSALREAVHEILVNEKLNILGTPELELGEIAPEKILNFTVKFALSPSVELPDYKKIGADVLDRKDNVSVSDKELDDALMHIRKIAARVADSNQQSVVSEEKEKENKEEDKLPELTDEFAQKMGNFKNVTEMTEEIKRELLAEKEHRMHEEKRDLVIKEIVQHAKIEIPELLLEQEWQRYVEERDEHLEKAGMTLEAYLKEMKLSEKALEKEERARIEEQLKTSLVFKKIQESEKIGAEPREIAANLAYLKRRYPDREPADLRRSAEAYIIQEKIFKLFEPAEEEAKVEKEVMKEN